MDGEITSTRILGGKKAPYNVSIYMKKLRDIGFIEPTGGKNKNGAIKYRLADPTAPFPILI